MLEFNPVGTLDSRNRNFISLFARRVSECLSTRGGLSGIYHSFSAAPSAMTVLASCSTYPPHSACVCPRNVLPFRYLACNTFASCWVAILWCIKGFGEWLFDVGFFRGMVVIVLAVNVYRPLYFLEERSYSQLFCSLVYGAFWREDRTRSIAC